MNRGGSRIISDYRRRFRELGWKKYLRALFCWNLTTLIVVVIVFPFGLIFYWLNYVPPLYLVWVLGFLFLARAVFHRRIGLLADEKDASIGAAALIGLSTIGIWAYGGFKPVGEDKWRELLGLVGVLISYILPVMIFIVKIGLVLAFPAVFIRGLEEPYAWQPRTKAPGAEP